MATTHEIIRRASLPEVERLKKGLLATANHRRKMAAIADSAAAKAECEAMAERLNEIHISICFAEKQAFEPQPGGRGKTRSGPERVYEKQRKERHCLKGIDTEAIWRRLFRRSKKRESCLSPRFGRVPQRK